MGYVHAFHFGTADAFLLELDTNAGVEWVLLDGGSKRWSGPPLVSLLKEKGVPSLALMVLTHLHQDHIGYLQDVANVLPVKHAVLPYPPLALTSAWTRRFLEKERANDIAVYNGLHARLASTHTPVETIFPAMQRAPLYTFGAYSMQCICPAPATASPVYEAFLKMRRLKNEDAVALYESVRGQINADSSVWLLKKHAAPVALFCADCLASSLDAYLHANPSFTCPLVKLSHHGRNDKGNVYFTPQQLQRIQPSQILLTSSAELFAQNEASLRALHKSAALRWTGESAKGLRLPL